MISRRTKFSLLAFALLLSACTIVPKPVTATHASIGLSGKADSGIIEFPHNGAPGTIDQHAMDRYNALIDRYGDDPEFQPALVHNEGVTVDEHGLHLDAEGFRRFALLNGWRRSGKIPVQKRILQRIGL